MLTLTATADDALLEEIAAHADDHLWMKIARLSVLPDAVWVRATQGAEQVRCALAENPSTPVAILMQLAADASITLQQSLVMNPNLPTALIAEMIARDRFSLMRAAHRQPNVEIQALIAQHDDAEVRRAVARNPAVHHSVVARLAYDPNDSVRESALHTCLAPWDVLPTLFGITLDMLDAHLRTTQNLPRGITRHPDARVRRAIVANPHASVHATIWQSSRPTRSSERRGGATPRRYDRGEDRASATTAHRRCRKAGFFFEAQAGLACREAHRAAFVASNRYPPASRVRPPTSTTTRTVPASIRVTRLGVR